MGRLGEAGTGASGRVPCQEFSVIDAIRHEHDCRREAGGVSG